MNRTRKRGRPLLGQILQKVAPRIRAKVLLEPEWGIVGQITFQNGRRRYFRYSSLDLNSLGAAEISRDKDYANFFMEKMGYPVIPGSKTFFSTDWARAIGLPRRNINAAYRHARKLGFPVIVKPNSGSQGRGVALVHTRREFYRAMRIIFKHDRVALVQRPVKGKDYRLVVLDGKVISAYERIPLKVVGDGQSTILGLLKKKKKQFTASGRDTQIKTDDPRIAEKLNRQGLTLRSVPLKGVTVYLLDSANLSAGGESVDVTDKVNSAFKRFAVKLTRDMGLRLCGVDLIVQGDISRPLEKFWVLEVNAAPGLDHYAKSCRVQARIVENLYTQVLKSMEY